MGSGVVLTLTKLQVGVMNPEAHMRKAIIEAKQTRKDLIGNQKRMPY